MSCLCYARLAFFAAILAHVPGAVRGDDDLDDVCLPGSTCAEPA
eukprot:CAMPEP_0115514966 /NCGR_PEP_ID=MMETSP0271-20121206/75951_1 /TAXON_ID=71861 /ORGANISM="Scrippsiella trochoidea, Strain CCMP3099" /LENGTH=43 /DNA_ID= /DNA_START= /DNA_END= /DNA_ORIENTATION=